MQLAAGTRRSAAGWLVGLVLVGLGEAVRLWSVAHIGPGSRTTGEQVWDLVDSGPYALCRNPIYTGNAMAWTGVGAVSGAGWALAWAVLAAVHYGLVVRFEEQRLCAELGERYRAYRDAVPRWRPRLRPVSVRGRWGVRESLRGERSTLAAIALVLALLVFSGGSSGP